MKKFKVVLTDDAVHDLEEIHGFIFKNDSPAAADHVLNTIEKAFKHLEEFPQRGSFPKEFLALGVKDYRESFFKPYRVIYRTLQDTVYAYLIGDGRREMQTLLTRRLLRGN